MLIRLAWRVFEKVAEFMKTGHFFISEDGIDQFLDEIYQYVWDENTGEPKKENDGRDGFNAVRNF